MSRHYLDYASTAPLRPAALQAMLEVLELPAADPSRIHSEALTIRQLLELGRQSVAGFVGARAREICFVSSATEGIVSTIWGASQSGDTILTTTVEHSAVTESALRASNVEFIEVDKQGLIEPEEVGKAIDRLRSAGKDVALFACQWVNHEVGAVQPIEAAISAAKQRGVKVMLDASQGIGRLPFDFATSEADVVVFSGHKLGAPAGVGVVVIRRGVRFPPLFVGGSQERARRAGFENTPAAVALGAVCSELATTGAKEQQRCRIWSNTIRHALSSLEGVELHGPEQDRQRAPHIVSAAIDDIEPQAILLGLDQAGIAVHSGSACAAEDIQPSATLKAMGVEGHRSLRVSVGWKTDDADVSAFIDALPQVMSQLRALR